MILGLDASTTVCGWCILGNDGTVTDAGYVKFSSDSTLYQRLRILREKLLELFPTRNALSVVFIEEAKKMFGGKSTAHVMSLLQRWNGMVSAMISLEFVDPVLLNERSARKLVGISLPSKCKAKQTKSIVAEFVKNAGVLPEKTWEYKKSGNLKDYCLDVADAYVIARGGFLAATKVS